MKITETQLRRIVREAISAQDAKERFGDFMFGGQRSKGEENTAEEQELARKFKSWYNGISQSLDAETVAKVRDLRDTGLYDDVLDTPPGAKRAYRVITLRDREDFDDLAGAEIAPDEIRALTENERKYLESGVVSLRRVRPGSTSSIRSAYDSAASSWSTDVVTVTKIQKQWLRNSYHRGLAYLVSDFSQNPKGFAINPDEMTVLAGEYSWQYEVMQVTPTVKLSGGVVGWIDKSKIPSDVDWNEWSVNALSVMSEAAEKAITTMYVKY